MKGVNTENKRPIYGVLTEPLKGNMEKNVDHSHKN